MWRVMCHSLVDGREFVFLQLFNTATQNITTLFSKNRHFFSHLAKTLTQLIRVITNAKQKNAFFKHFFYHTKNGSLALLEYLEKVDFKIINNSCRWFISHETHRKCNAGHLTHHIFNVSTGYSTMNSWYFHWNFKSMDLHQIGNIFIEEMKY